MSSSNKNYKREEATMSNNDQEQNDELVDRFREQVENVPEQEEPDPNMEASPDQEEPPQDDIDQDSVASDPGPDTGASEDQKKKSCRQIVKLGDQGQHALFYWLYRRAYFTDAQWEAINRNDLPNKKGAELEDQTLIQLKELYNKFSQTLETIPLNDHEIEDLTDHIKEAMDHLEKQPPSPVTAAAIAIISTLGARAMPLLTINNG
jgi:hypothetical protein